MKILGIVLPILLSSLTITHGKKKLGKGASLDSGAAIPVYYDSSSSYGSSDCEDPVTYQAVPGIVVPASSVTYSAVPASPVAYSAAPSGELSKKGKKGSGISYQDVLGSLGKGLSFDKKGKGHHGGGASGTPVVYSAKVQPVQYVVPVQPSYPQDDCYDSVPAVVPVSYKPVSPVNYGAVPISYQKPVAYEAVPIGPSVSFPHNVAPVTYGAVPIGPSVSYQKPVGYGAVPIGASLSYPHNVGAVAYEPVSVGPSLSYPSTVGPSLSYPNTVGPSPSLSYPSTVGPVAYEPVSVGPVSYGVPVGPSVSYPKSVGPVSIGHAGNYAPTYVTPSYSEVGSSVVVVPGHQHSHNKLGLLAGKKHKPVHGGYYGHPSHAVSTYAPASEGPYMIVPSGHSPHGYGHGYDC